MRNIIFDEIYDINTKFLDKIQKSMTPKVAQSLYGKKLTKYISEIKKAEQKAPAETKAETEATATETQK